MIKNKIARKGNIEIDLTGPQGNAYALIGYATRFAREMGRSQLQIDTMKEEMMSGDYEHLVQVFDKNFGSFVTLYR